MVLFTRMQYKHRPIYQFNFFSNVSDQLLYAKFIDVLAIIRLAAITNRHRCAARQQLNLNNIYNGLVQYKPATALAHNKRIAFISLESICLYRIFPTFHITIV